ncbi:hypothetical protein [Sphingomonas sp. TWP1-3-1]|uniref:hypothetical protein n=1 Tax=Sphingomonas sp. TWP1-3-1 TaxID=2804612 RepID=UPI003CEF4E07
MSGEKLLVLAERCEAADGPDRRLDYEIMCATVRQGRGYIWDPEGQGHRYLESYDAAMSLVPLWLTPTIIGHAREVRLLNGIGFPVGGNDFRSVAASLPRAITAAALRARAHQESVA